MRAITIHATRPTPPPTGYVLPTGVGNFWRQRWDEQIPPDHVVRESADNVNGGTPATRVTVEGEFVPLNREHQHWLIEEVWFNAAPPAWVTEYKNTRPERRASTTLGQKFANWSDSGLAWFNHEHGSDVRAVYDLFLNLKKPDGSPNSPIAKQMLGSAGNLVLQAGAIYKDGKGTEYVPCKALRPNELPSWNELLLMPWVFNVCTTQRWAEMGSYGYHMVNPFPQLTTPKPEGKVYDVPLILVSNNGIITFKKDLLSPVAAGTKVPCPYNPYRKFGDPLAVWN